MEYKTIDYLIEQLNEIIMKPSAESLRANTMTNVRHVFSKLGYHLVCEEEWNYEIPIVGQKWNMPNDIVDILDIGTNRFNYNGTSMKAGYIPGHGLNFRKTPLGILFPGMNDTTLYAIVYKFYKDDMGYLIIPEEAYTACFDYCAWKAIVASNNPKLPLWGDRFAFADQSRVSMAEARGMLNKMNSADYRTIRKMS